MSLTERQQEIVTCVGEHLMSYKATARALGISPQTVAHHATKIRDQHHPDDNPRVACIRIYRDNQPSMRPPRDTGEDG